MRHTNQLFMPKHIAHTRAHTCKAQSQSLKRESGVGSIKINETHKRFKEETDKVVMPKCYELNGAALKAYHGKNVAVDVKGKFKLF